MASQHRWCMAEFREHAEDEWAVMQEKAAEDVPAQLEVNKNDAVKLMMAEELLSQGFSIEAISRILNLGIEKLEQSSP